MCLCGRPDLGFDVFAFASVSLPAATGASDLTDDRNPKREGLGLSLPDNKSQHCKHPKLKKNKESYLNFVFCIYPSTLPPQAALLRLPAQFASNFLLRFLLLSSKNDK